MGQARTRKLSLVAQAATGEPIEIALGDKSARRLAGLLFASQGAELAAKAADQQRVALRTQYEAALAGVLEAHGVEATGGVNHDVDRNCLTVTPAPATPSETAPSGP